MSAFEGSEWQVQMEAAKEAAERAKARNAEVAPAETAPPRQPTWIAAAAKLAGQVLSPEELERRRLAAERADEEARERRAKAEEGARERRLAASLAAIPARYRDITADSARTRVASRAAVDATVAMVDRIAEKRGPSVVVWTGLSGAGKTTCACLAARLWIERWSAQNISPHITYTRAAQLAVASRYHALGEGRPAAVQEAINTGLLVLDELGTEPRNAQWSDVDDVVFARYEQDMPTWVTTWMEPDAMAAKYGDGFARRIFEGATVIQCGGAK